MRRIVLGSATRPGLTRRDYWLAAGAADVVTISCFVLRALDDRVELAALALGHPELRKGLVEVVVRSGHLGHTQVGERQLEVALVEHLCSYFLAARGSDSVQPVSVPVHRFDAVEGRRGHATTGCSVD
jgi:hypothetical protein